MPTLPSRFSGGANHAATLNTANLGNQLSQGDQNATSADIRIIRDNEKLKVPSDISQTCITLHRFAVLCQVLFQGEGEPHPFVEALWRLGVDMHNAVPFIAERYQQLDPPVPSGTYFPTIIRAVQIAAQEYLQWVGTTTGDATENLPEYRTLVSDLHRGGNLPSFEQLARYTGRIPYSRPQCRHRSLPGRTLLRPHRHHGSELGRLDQHRNVVSHQRYLVLVPRS